MNTAQFAALSAASFCLGVSVTIRLLAWMSARFHQDPTERWLFGLATLAPFALAVAFSLLAALVNG